MLNDILFCLRKPLHQNLLQNVEWYSVLSLHTHQMYASNYKFSKSLANHKIANDKGLLLAELEVNKGNGMTCPCLDNLSTIFKITFMEDGSP